MPQYCRMYILIFNLGWPAIHTNKAIGYLILYTFTLLFIHTNITYNSTLDASPPKASKLPEVILSSMDLLAKNTHKITCVYSEMMK